MTVSLQVQRVGPGASLQDAGRPGYLSQGISIGGCADVYALAEIRALTGSDMALELPGGGASFMVVGGSATLAIAGAPAKVMLDGRALQMPGAHLVTDGQVLEIGPVTAGVYTYLGVAGGFDIPEELGSRSAHLASGLGTALQRGDRFKLAAPQTSGDGLGLPADSRFSGGALRVLPGPQTALFDPKDRSRFETTAFTKDPRANRMGGKLAFEGPGFAPRDGLSLASEVVVPGDIQVVGAGQPFVLLGECQTTGGYPRLGTVISADLPRFAQASAGSPLTFRFVTLEEALEARRAARDWAMGLTARIAPIHRDPRDMADLLSYSLVSGVISATDPPP